MSGADDWDAAPRRDATAVPDQEARAALAASAAAPQQLAAGEVRRGADGRTDGRVDGRPAPQYGEYAPDGWVSPVVVEEQRRERERAADDSRQAGRSRPAGHATTGRGEPGPAGSGRGAAGGAPLRPGAGSTPARRPSTTPAGWRFGKTPVDLLLTLVLLAMGLVSVVQALSVGTVASTVRETLELQYTALADPGSLTGAATISAGGLLVLFVLVVWWSVVRLRATKRTFWVPLLGGAVASVFSTVVFLVVVFQDDHFVAYLMQHAMGG